MTLGTFMTRVTVRKFTPEKNCTWFETTRPLTTSSLDQRMLGLPDELLEATPPGDTIDTARAFYRIRAATRGGKRVETEDLVRSKGRRQ